MADAESTQKSLSTIEMIRNALASEPASVPEEFPDPGALMVRRQASRPDPEHLMVIITTHDRDEDTLSLLLTVFNDKREAPPDPKWVEMCEGEVSELLGPPDLKVIRHNIHCWSYTVPASLVRDM